MGSGLAPFDPSFAKKEPFAAVTVNTSLQIGAPPTDVLYKANERFTGPLASVPAVSVRYPWKSKV